MDSIKEFFKSIEERFSNPFILAFLLTWMAWNWSIPITLGFENSWSLRRLGYSSYEAYIIDYINKYPCKFYLLPVLSALLFTLGMPWLRAFIYRIQTMADIKKDEWWIDDTKESSVPMERYLSMRAQVIDKSKVLEQIIDTETSSQAKLTEQITKTQAAEALVLEQLNQIDSLKSNLSEKSESYGKLNNEYQKLKAEITSTDNIEDLFRGTWYNEFQIMRNDGSIHTDIELFDVKGLTINVRGNPEFYIDEPLILNRGNFISFKKRRVNDALDVTSVYLTKVPLKNPSQYFWVGYELNQKFALSFVRYYSKYNIPNYVNAVAIVKHTPIDSHELTNPYRAYALLQKLITNKDFE